MTEREMEDLLWNYPEVFFREPLKQHKRQSSSSVSRADLVFVDSQERLLVIEVKKGVFPRNGVPQILDHVGSVKSQNTGLDVEGMVVANLIPLERKSTLDRFHIEWREIPEQRFREVAAEKGYDFQSEKLQPVVDPPPITPVAPVTPAAPITPGASTEAIPGQPVKEQSQGTEGWIKVEWKDDNTDSVAVTLRKDAFQKKRVGDSFDPTWIHGIILNILRDQEVHAVADLHSKAGGARGDFRNKIKHVAHRGNCNGEWHIYHAPDWKRVQLTVT